MPRTPGRWYERGKGSMYANAAGVVKVIKPSEMLSQWGSMRRTFTPQLAEVVIGRGAHHTLRTYMTRNSRTRLHKATVGVLCRRVSRNSSRSSSGALQEAIDKAMKG